MTDPRMELSWKSSEASSSPTVEDIQIAYQASLAKPNAEALPGLNVIDARCTEGRSGSFLCEVTYRSSNEPQKGKNQTDLVAIEREGENGWTLISGMCRALD